MSDDHELARRLAAAAGDLLLQLRLDRPRLTGSELGRAGDRVSHTLLTRALRTCRPTDAILSEEGGDAPTRARPHRVWVVDPLDGTREFAERDRTDWAVHVALVVRDQPVAGAVAMPAAGIVLGTDRPPRLPDRDRRSGRRIRIAVSRTRRPAVVDRVRANLDVDVVPMGSAGAKTVAVLTGEVDAYLHAGGQYEWDSAAPVAVARAAGAHASRLDGSALVYNNPSPRLPDLLVCHPAHRDTLLGALARSS
ncbi:MAG TPA: inositol monophosphatase family protein [Actinophytocola sp.]|uniref:inositol monophosphatase family protein n=1 Tax=Actinophytocola sp. TaxID=1872138 RepID=UPI002DDD9AAD|nr:inositol monophosphatase family protein [Actinophytocola sp.]HEV2783344.1 inositol monophosphatase family protein [Actinophytocola sp.]